MNTGKRGINLAGILLIGTDDMIHEACPAHGTECIARRHDPDGCDDRDFFATNLLDSQPDLELCPETPAGPLPSRGLRALGLLDVIFREISTNMLMHREYMSTDPARLIVERGKVCAYNGYVPRTSGQLDPEYTPYLPGNPGLESVFRTMGLAGEPRSGMDILVKYGKLYSGTDPRFVEDDVFQTIVAFLAPAYPDNRPLQNPEAGPERKASGKGKKTGSTAFPGEIQLGNLQACLTPQDMKSLLALFGKRHRTCFCTHHLDPLLHAGLLERTRPHLPASKYQRYRTTGAGKRKLQRSGMGKLTSAAAALCCQIRLYFQRPPRRR